MSDQENHDQHPTEQDDHQISGDELIEEEPQQRATSGRGRKLQVLEDFQLCRSWLFISQDPVVGNNQRGRTWWQRIFNRYREQLPNTARSASSLESRWRDISKLCTKYCGHLSQCQGAPRSGEGSSDIVNRALERYADEMKQAFDLMHCYNVLKASPKWNNVLGASVEKATRRAAAAGPSRLPTVAGPSRAPFVAVLSDAPQESENDEPARTIGRKQAKGNGNEKRDRDEHREEIAARQVRMLENQERRLTQMEESNKAVVESSPSKNDVLYSWVSQNHLSEFEFGIAKSTLHPS